MHPILMVALGGASGALLRYGSVGAVQRLTGAGQPLGTLFVNVVGSFALGFLLILAERSFVPEDARLFGAVGLIGAFTTFSAFSWDVVWLAREGAWLRAGVYAFGSVALGVASLLAGAASASAIVGRP